MTGERSVGEELTPDDTHYRLVWLLYSVNWQQQSTKLFGSHSQITVPVGVAL